MGIAEYKEKWLKDNKNAGRSFTDGSCLYDYVSEGYNLDDDVESELIQAAVDSIGATKNTHLINVRAAVEILDIAEIDEIAERYLQDDGESE